MVIPFADVADTRRFSFTTSLIAAGKLLRAENVKRLQDDVDSVAVGSLTTDAAGREVDEQIISLHQEQLNVAIKSVVTGEIEISTVTRLRDVAIDEALVSQHADVERVAIGPRCARRARYT